ncbi:uncharacterized protein LOC143452510 [Clavelina lepadiformis]|uniref:uncharacterized protein LOC143452510 n=2 Tax=Clavelina lepadiformis TaxID=159417 RepID=UPI0040414650
MEMAKDELDQTPIPSYLNILGEELLVKYHGQLATCQYCNKPGHKHINCPAKNNSEYPPLEENNQPNPRRGMDYYRNPLTRHQSPGHTHNEENHENSIMNTNKDNTEDGKNNDSNEPDTATTKKGEEQPRDWFDMTENNLTEVHMNEDNSIETNTERRSDRKRPSPDEASEEPCTKHFKVLHMAI